MKKWLATILSILLFCSVAILAFSMFSIFHLHSFDIEVQEVTCEQYGLYECECGESKTVKAQGHDWYASNCYKPYRCWNCSERKDMDINGPHEDLDEDGYCDVCMWVLGEHKHVTYTVLTEAKCNEVGVKQCVCGEFIIIPKTDHQWSAVDCKSNYSCLICSVTKDMDKNGPHADENNDGLCEVCNMIIGEHIHTYDVVRFEPTCFDFGEVQCKCRNDVFRVLPPLGHDFVNYACSRCDYISFLIRIQTYTGEFIEIYDEVKYGTTWNEWVSSYNSSDDIEEDVFYFSDTIDDLYYKVDGGLCSIYKDSASSHPVDGGLIYPGTYEATLTYFCYVDDVMHSFRYNTNTWESLNRHDVSTGREFLVHSDDPNAVVRLKTGEYLFDSAGNVCYYSDKIKAGERYVSGYLLSIDYRYGSGESEVLHIEEPIVPGTTWTEWAALYNETHKGPDGEGVIINNYGYVCFSEPGCSVVDGNGDPVLFNVEIVPGYYTCTPYIDFVIHLPEFTYTGKVVKGMTWSDWCSYQNSIEGSAWKDNEGFVCHDALSYDIYDRNGNKVFWNAEIVAGYYNNEPFSIITFTIDGVSYTAIEGQTWGDWVEEHSDEFQVGGHPAVSNGITKKPDGMVAVCTLTGGMRSPVNTTDIIVDGYAYVFRDYSVR